jgi:hypothetical protein
VGRRWDGVNRRGAEHAEGAGLRRFSPEESRSRTNTKGARSSWAAEHGTSTPRLDHDAHLVVPCCFVPRRRKCWVGCADLLEREAVSPSWRSRMPLQPPADAIRWIGGVFVTRLLCSRASGAPSHVPRRPDPSAAAFAPDAKSSPNCSPAMTIEFSAADRSRAPSRITTCAVLAQRSSASAGTPSANQSPDSGRGTEFTASSMIGWLVILRISEVDLCDAVFAASGAFPPLVLQGGLTHLSSYLDRSSLLPPQALPRCRCTIRWWGFRAACGTPVII